MTHSYKQYVDTFRCMIQWILTSVPRLKLHWKAVSITVYNKITAITYVYSGISSTTAFKRSLMPPPSERKATEKEITTSDASINSAIRLINVHQKYNRVWQSCVVHNSLTFKYTNAPSIERMIPLFPCFIAFCHFSQTFKEINK